MKLLQTGPHNSYFLTQRGYCWKFQTLIDIKALSWKDDSMEARRNNGPIIANFNALNLYTEIIVCTKFHQDI